MDRKKFNKKQIYSGDLILVNQEYPFDRDGGDQLVAVQENSPVLLGRRAAVLLANLMEEIKGWEWIVPVSGWRSFEEQQQIWDDTEKESGLAFTQKYVAVPGHSEHQTGLAIDLGLKQDEIDFICPEFPYTGICQKFRERAADYGFVERYPAGKEKITGIGHEPWHFRYVGVPHARIMKENDLVLEEYISFIKKFRYKENPYSVRLGGQEVFVSYLPSGNIECMDTRSDAHVPYSISGNNVDGFILTEWGQSLTGSARLRLA